jgi:3-methyladenine DNA glycosylase AlkD
MQSTAPMPRRVTAPSPAVVERLAMRELRAAADPRVARRSAAFFKPGDTVAALGVKAAVVRRVARDLAHAVRDTWSADLAIAFCDRMCRRRQQEPKAVGVLLLGRFRQDFPRDLVLIVRVWIEEGRFANWAAIDILCPEILTPLVERYPGLDRAVRRWANADLLWLRRAAAVTFVPLARRGERLDSAYDVAWRLRNEPEDIVQKACGWLLREVGRTDPDRLRRFLTDRGAEFPRITVRYAIERFPAPMRRRLLQQTRSR